VNAKDRAAALEAKGVRHVRTPAGVRKATAWLREHANAYGKKSLPEFKDIVRTQAGVDKYHQPIGSFIVKDAVLPYLDVTEAIPDKLYYAAVHGGPTYTVKKSATTPFWARTAGHDTTWRAEEVDSKDWPDEHYGAELKEVLQTINDQYDPDWVNRVNLTPPPKDSTPPYNIGGYFEDNLVDYNADRARKTLRNIYEATMGDKEIDDPDLRKYPYEAFESDVVAAIKQQYQNANDYTTIFVPDEDVLKHILVDGRFKSQFESGTSSGLLSNSRRGQVEAKEHKQMGVPFNIPDMTRPIYGSSEPDSEEWSIASRYGRIAIGVTGIEGRVTATLGDSLDWTLIPVTPDETSRNRILASAAPHALRYLGESVIEGETGIETYPDSDDRYYVEVQIHGGLGADNITEVGFPYQAYDTAKPSTVQAKRLLEHMRIKAYDDDRPWGEW
jgi:hypothetical protein